MSKIICEICGTAYPDTESQCPICGWTQDGLDLGIDSSDLDFTAEEDVPASQSRKNREIFDYDAVNSKAKKGKAVPRKPEEEPEEEEEEEERSANPFLVVLLTILIVALLGATAFVLLKYFLPNLGDKAPETTAPVITTGVSEETTNPRIPCTDLSLVSGITVLNAEGQNWLLHVVVTPEDTTDTLTFESLDESIATVNEEGRVTAIAEGETTVVITCGDKVLKCPVTVSYQEPTEGTESPTGETEAPTEAPGGETEAPTEAPTGATEEPPATESTGSTGVVLKLKKTDITFGVQGVYTTLELDCDLKPEDITWSTRNSNVATVKNGVVTSVGPGLTVITAKYGDQTVECIVRCNF